MGILIIQKGANYSQNGLGQIVIPNLTEWDTSALTYIERIALTDEAQKRAVSDLCTNLKEAFLWDKITSLLPFLGTTEAQQKGDIKNDVSPLTLVGGLNLSNGCPVLSSTCYFKTSIRSDQAGHAAVTLSSPTNGMTIIGGQSFYGVGANTGFMTYNSGSGFEWWNMNPLMKKLVSESYAVTKGSFILSLSGVTGNYIYNNTNLIYENTVGITSNVTPNKWALGAWLDYATDPTNITPLNPVYTNSGIGIASFGGALTKLECVTFTNIINTYLTALNRI